MAASSSATAEGLTNSTSACNASATDRQEPIDHSNGRPSLPHVRHKDVTDSSTNSVPSVPHVAGSPWFSASWSCDLREIRALACLTQRCPSQLFSGPAILDDT